MALPFTVYIDMEMNIIHTDQGCPGLKIPTKYNYRKMMLVRTVEEARDLDRKHRPCDRCKNLMLKTNTPVEKKPFRKRGYDGGRS